MLRDGFQQGNSTCLLLLAKASVSFVRRRRPGGGDNVEGEIPRFLQHQAGQARHVSLNLETTGSVHYNAS